MHGRDCLFLKIVSLHEEAPRKERTPMDILIKLSIAIWLLTGLSLVLWMLGVFPHG